MDFTDQWTEYIQFRYLFSNIFTNKKHIYVGRAIVVSQLVILRPNYTISKVTDASSSVHMKKSNRKDGRFPFNLAMMIYFLRYGYRRLQSSSIYFQPNLFDYCWEKILWREQHLISSDSLRLGGFPTHLSVFIFSQNK